MDVNDSLEPRQYAINAAFNIKANKKFNAVLDTLKLGFNPFLVDVDVVFIQDPREIVYTRGLSHDLVVQSDSDFRRNSGFFYCRSTEKMMSTFQKAHDIGLKGKQTNQQIFINVVGYDVCVLRWSVDACCSG